MANGVDSAVTKQAQQGWRFGRLPLVARLAIGFWIGFLCASTVTFIKIANTAFRRFVA